MSDRKTLGKKVRFEVFKRDKFTCQYCGAKAPEVVLQVDHIQPVAEGGTDEILNLLTACAGCNGGKGKVLLTDLSVVERQRRQIEELEERRQQLEMMLEWRNGLSELDESVVEAIVDHVASRGGGFTPNENGRQHIRRWLKRFSFEEISRAIDHSFTHYLIFRDDKATKESWETAFDKVPSTAAMLRKSDGKPYYKDLLYLQGILRKRIGDKWLRLLDQLEDWYLDGMPIETMTRIAKEIETEDEFWAELREIRKQHMQAR